MNGELGFLAESEGFKVEGIQRIMLEPSVILKRKGNNEEKHFSTKMGSSAR